MGQNVGVGGGVTGAGVGALDCVGIAEVGRSVGWTVIGGQVGVFVGQSDGFAEVGRGVGQSVIGRGVGLVGLNVGRAIGARVGKGAFVGMVVGRGGEVGGEVASGCGGLVGNSDGWAVGGPTGLLVGSGGAEQARRELAPVIPTGVPQPVGHEAHSVAPMTSLKLFSPQGTQSFKNGVDDFSELIATFLVVAPYFPAGQARQGGTALRTICDEGARVGDEAGICTCSNLGHDRAAEHTPKRLSKYMKTTILTNGAHFQ